MSSTSSSSGCEFDEYFHYADHSPIKTPYYSTMGHPLIYFAQIEPQNITKKCCQRERKPKKNCFKKAFNWYTHEITLNENMKNRSSFTDVPEFVTWLDNKYEEFLNETSYAEKLIIANKTAQKQTICESNKKEGKKKSRFRSPWRRRRRSSNLKEGEDSSIPKDKSFVCIMKPTDMTSRQPSDSLLTCCNESDPNLSSGTTFTKKNVLKSKSYSSIFESENPNPVDVVPLQEGIGNKTGAYKPNESQPGNCAFNNHPLQKQKLVTSTQCEEMEMKYGLSCCEDALQTNRKKAAKNKKKVKTQNSSCQYYDALEKKLRKKQSAKSKNINVTCECLSPLPQVPTYRESSLDKGQINNKISVPPNGQLHEVQEQDSSNVTKIPRRFSRLQEITSTSKDYSTSDPIRFFTTFVDDMAQTSDHSLRIENNGLNDYPLFMKVICPDKLNEEY